VLGAALFLGACVNSPEESAPVDPKFAKAKVDAQVAGNTLVGSFEQGKEWNTTVTAPNVQALGQMTTSLGTLKKHAALAKLAADTSIGDGLIANFSDTAKGYVTIYHKYNIGLNTIEDTAVIKWDEKAKDTIKDNEFALSFKRVNYGPFKLKVETTEFADADGDGIVTAQAGKDNKVKLTITVAEGAVTEKAVLVVGAGKDANFDKEEDNTILEAKWTKTKGGAVIGTGVFLDEDKDGVITDNSKTCIVVAEYSDIEPKDRPLIARAEFKAKVRILANKAGDEPISFSYTETTKFGRTNTVTIKNREGGDEIVKGDTMRVFLKTSVSRDDDTLKSASVEFVMNPGQDLKSDADDVCYAIHITSDKRFGLERHAEFHFVSATPIPHGQEPTAGTFSGKADYANGKSISLKGSFSPDGFEAEFTGPEGTASIKWSKTGTVL
jgi:hypothetical protein